MNNKSIVLKLDPSTDTTGNAEQVAQLIGAAAWRISGDCLLVEDCVLSYRVTDNETYASVGMTKIPNGATVELWEGELQVSYDLGKEEQHIEQEIQDKGLNAPRLTPDHIDSKIKSVEYILPRDVCKRDNGVEIFDAPLPLQTLTFCILTLENGFTVTGESACVSPENFDAEIGKKIAYENACEKIWMLEGYLLKQHLYSYSIAPAKSDKAPGTAPQNPWTDIPTYKILPFIGSISFEYVSGSETELEHFRCYIGGCGKDKETDVISSAADLNASLSNAINSLKEIAFKNGWLD